MGELSKSLPRLGMISTSLARAPRRPQELPDGEFWVSPSNLLCCVALPGGATGGVGVDERVEGASGRPPGFMLLDVYQVEQAAQVRPLVEPHSSMAIFDDSNQTSDEIDAVGTVIIPTVTSVSLHGDRLVHAFLLGAMVRPGRRGESPSRTPRLPRPYHPECQTRLSADERSVKACRAGSSHPAGREFMKTP